MSVKELVIVWFIAFHFGFPYRLEAMQTRIIHRPSLSLHADLNFATSHLPTEARIWYGRLWAAINNPRQSPNATKLANSNNTYYYGRNLNTHITSLLHAFRVTGDLRLLDEVDRLSQIMRSKLKDWSILTEGGSKYESDGYLNWLYMRDNSWQGTDIHEMDDMLSHSLVASFAYAFYVNRDLDSKYAERAAFWADYLKNHFEAKWRDRKGIPSGFPFLTKRLTHVYMQWIRYHYYMYRLTGDEGYYDEALKMADVIKKHLKYFSTPLGDAAQWDHGMPILGTSSYGSQPFKYARYAVQAAADLAAEGFHIFGQTEFMTTIAVTLAKYIMYARRDCTFPYRIDGSGANAKPERAKRLAISPWTMLGRWDPAGKILKGSERIYKLIESYPNNPRRIYIPAGMVFSLMANSTSISNE